MRAHLAAVAVVLVATGCSSTQASGPTAPPSSGHPTPTSPSGAAVGVPSTAPSAPASAPPQLTVRTMRWRLPVPLAREAVVAQGRRRYVVAGGLVAGDASTADVFMLDTRRGRTRAVSSLSVPVHDTAGVLLGGQTLVLGGGNGAEQDVVQSDGASGWSVAGHLPQPRSDLMAAQLGEQTAGRAMVVGGYDAVSVAVPSILTSSDGAHWRTVGSLPVPVRYAASVVYDSAMWLFGGERDHVMQRAVQRITPSGRAKVVAQLPMPLGHAIAVDLGDRILIAGGRPTYTTLTDRMWWFDPATKKFTRAGRLPVELADSAVAAQGHTTAYLVGGESPAVSDRVVRLRYR